MNWTNLGFESRFFFFGVVFVVSCFFVVFLFCFVSDIYFPPLNHPLCTLVLSHLKAFSLTFFFLSLLHPHQSWNLISSLQMTLNLLITLSSSILRPPRISLDVLHIQAPLKTTGIKAMGNKPFFPNVTWQWFKLFCHLSSVTCSYAYCFKRRISVMKTQSIHVTSNLKHKWCFIAMPGDEVLKWTSKSSPTSPRHFGTGLKIWPSNFTGHRMCLFLSIMWMNLWVDFTIQTVYEQLCCD